MNAQSLTPIKSTSEAGAASRFSRMLAEHRMELRRTRTVVLQINAGKLESFGSGVLLRILDYRVLISAAHVLNAENVLHR